MNIKQISLAAAGLLTASAGMAQTTFEEGGLLYTEDLTDPSKMAVIVMPKQNPVTMWGMYSGNVVVPATIEHDLDTYEVTGIANFAFQCPELTGLDIQAPIATVPSTAISGDKIQSIKFPDCLESFTGCIAPNIENLYLGKSLKDINISLMTTNNLQTLNIPNTIEKIEYSFQHCNQIKSLNLAGDNLKLLKNSFSTMPALESLTIKGNELVIDCCFGYEINNLKDLRLSGVKIIRDSFKECNVDKLVLEEGLTEIEHSSFQTFNGTELTLPNSLTTLDDWSFRNCPNLKVVRLSKGVCSLGHFHNGNGETIYCPWDEVPEPPYFDRTADASVTFVVPVGMEEKYREAWAKKLKYVKEEVIFREEKF